MKIGFDLDGVMYDWPEIFVPLTKLLHENGHQLFITSNHTKIEWINLDRDRLAEMGYNPCIFDATLIWFEADHRFGAAQKTKMADQLDFVFDDDADAFQAKTKVPIFKVPRKGDIRG
jgi:hypothetical protein